MQRTKHTPRRRQYRSALHTVWLTTLSLLFFGIQFGCGTISDYEKLHALMDEAEAFEIGENPFRSDEEEEGTENDRLWSESMDDLERRYRFWNEMEGRLENEVRRENLDSKGQITYDSFVRQVRHHVREFEHQRHLIPINHEGGFYNRLVGLENRVPLDSLQNYNDYLDRLRAIPAYFDQHIDRMRRGIKEGYTLPSVIFVDEYDSYIKAHIKENPEESHFFDPFREFPERISEEDRRRFREEAAGVIKREVMPAYTSFVEFLNTEYIPNTRQTIATADLPGGEEYYNYLIEYHTTLPLSAEEIHQTGLNEVKRIREEMAGIIDDTGFEGDFDEFLEFLRTDPQFYVDEPEELLKEASWLAKRMDGKLTELFHLHNLPRRPYGVEPVPDHLAPRYTGGRYSPGGGTRAAQYWVNTYNLPSRTLYTLEALTYHEAVPGHHLQIGLHREMEDLPRRSGGLTAYTEGWALYAERLGMDAGFYENPYNDFGRLTYEMWRACRLVVDTGMHALGWSREQAVEFMTRNTALSHHEIDTEINRYIAVPGQALAYKMGELKIRELRELAEKELGDHFKIRDFHEAVLNNGPVTLPMLEQQIQSYIDKETAKEEP